MLSAEISARYQEWLNAPWCDEATKAELQGLQHNEKEIEDRFYCELEFGTGGMRGLLGAGTNRMNIYTVRTAPKPKPAAWLFPMIRAASPASLPRKPRWCWPLTKSRPIFLSSCAPPPPSHLRCEKNTPLPAL